MERNAKFILSLFIMILAATGIGVYAYFQSREFLSGPQVIITHPADGSSFTDRVIAVSGTASNIAYLSLNDSPIFVDAKGIFQEKFILLPGYNIISIKAKDRFGKTVEKTLELVYKEPQKEIMASSSPFRL